MDEIKFINGVPQIDDGWAEANQLAIKRKRDARTKDPNRGQILPLYFNEDGTTDWALPQWAMEAVNAITLTSDVLKGYEPTIEDTTNFATSVAGGGMSSSLIAGQAKDPNTLGMFLGRNARRADTRALSKAMSLKDQGIDPRQIWDETGWFEGLDGKWKWELPDDNFDINREGMQEAFDLKKKKSLPWPPRWSREEKIKIITPDEPTSSGIKHPDLFSQYPDTSNLPPPIDKPYVNPFNGKEVNPTTRFGLFEDDGLSPNYAGYYQPDTQEIYAEGTTLDRIRWVVAHELSHAVAEREGFEKGSNLNETANLISNIAKFLPDTVAKYIEKKGIIKEIEKDLSTTKNSVLEDQLKREKESIVQLEKELAPILPEVEKINKLLFNDVHQNYQRNAGEVEARIVQKRLGRTAEENRKIFPLDDLDVPEDEVWTFKELDSLRTKLHNWEQNEYERTLDAIVNTEAEKGYEEGLNELIDPKGYAKGGMVIDPVSGNEVPPGARPEEVRDDIDIKASEGEYIIPANVVRFLGVDKLEKMVTKAQEALQELDDDGRIGGEEGEDLEELPFDIATLNSVEDEPVQSFAEGGVVENQNNVSTLPGVETKEYRDDSGNVIFIPWINGAPMFQPPPNYSEVNTEAVTNKAPNPMSNVSTGTVNVGNDPSPNERTQGKSPLAGSPTEWSVDNFLDYTKQKNDLGSKAIKGIISMMPGGGLAMKVRDKFLDHQASQLFDTMIETGVDPVGNQITPEQRAQLIESRNQLKKQMSDSSGLNLNPIERLTDAFSTFAKFTNPQAAQGSSGAPRSSLSPEATRMVTSTGNNKSDNQYSGGNVSVGSDLGKKNNGPTSDSMRSGGLYSAGGLVSRRNKTKQ